MNSHFQLSLLSVMLVLVMYFAFQSFQSGETALELYTGRKCPDGAYCLFRPCSNPNVVVDSGNQLTFQGEKGDKEQIYSLLKEMGDLCDIKMIYFYSSPGVSHGDALKLSGELKELFPSAEIVWGKVKIKDVI